MEGKCLIYQFEFIFFRLKMDQLRYHVYGNSLLFMREIDHNFVCPNLRVDLSDHFVENTIQNYNQYHESTHEGMIPFSYYDIALTINYLVALNLEDFECISKSQWCSIIENALLFIEETTFIENEPLTKKMLIDEI